MSNFFLGFPVARAKIADMISGSAPPLAHKTQHQDGGVDELDLSGLSGAGGLVGDWDDIYLVPAILSVDGFQTTLVDTGTVTPGKLGISLQTGVNANSGAEAYAILDTIYPTINWDRERRFRAVAFLNCTTDATGDYWIISGEEGTNRHIGFYVSAGILYATCADGTTQNTSAIKTLGASNYFADLDVVALLDPGVNCKFYVNGVLEETLTANLPTGTSYAAHIVRFIARNLASANNKIMTMRTFMFYLKAT